MAEDDGWDGAVLKCEQFGRFLGKIHLIEKHGDTDTDEGHRDNGSDLGRIIVVKRNHGGPWLWSSAVISDETRQFKIGRRASVDL